MTDAQFAEMMAMLRGIKYLIHEYVGLGTPDRPPPPEPEMDDPPPRPPGPADAPT